MLVKEAMRSNPPKIHHNATIKEAAEMLTLSQSGELVVVDQSDKIMGMLGSTEILRRLIPQYDELLSKGGTPSGLKPQRRSTDSLPRIKVTEVMRSVPTSLDPEQNLESALGLLLENGGRPLPVAMEGKLAGCLSTADVARALMWRGRVSPSNIHPQEERRKNA